MCIAAILSTVQFYTVPNALQSQKAYNSLENSNNGNVNGKSVCRG